MSSIVVKTTEMHTGGEPLRIIESGYPEIQGNTILDKRRYVKQHLDHLRTFLMFEPRGHYDMYGALMVTPDLPKADLAVLFLHNEGYSTMCGHAIMALGRYAIDKGLVKNVTSPETEVCIQCPCGLVKSFVEYDGSTTGRVRFHSVPAFAFALDLAVEVDGYGSITLDIGYGGAFYAFVPAQKFGLDLRTSMIAEITRVATLVSDATKKSVKVHHPDNSDLAFVYGTIITDGRDEYSGEPTANICVFADKQVDRSPCGSGVTARIALQHAKGLIAVGQTRIFENSATGSQFTGKAISTSRSGDFNAVIVEVSGKGHYTGTAEFTMEDDDCQKHGFLVK